MLAGADYFLSHVSLVFDDRKSQPLIAGAVLRIRGQHFARNSPPT
jgi:hypothetical protein